MLDVVNDVVLLLLARNGNTVLYVSLIATIAMKNPIAIIIVPAISMTYLPSLMLLSWCGIEPTFRHFLSWWISQL